MAAATSTLLDIQNKVRRITRSLSPSQLSEDELNQYINTFIAYDFPEHLRLFNLRRTFDFITEPYEAFYPSSDDPASPLYDFKNRYITVHPPIYVAGFQAAFYESREQFFNVYPKVNQISSIGVTGNGATQQFTGFINTQQANVFPFVQNNTQGVVLLKDNVLFSSVDINYAGLSLVDYPISASIGNLFVPGGQPTSFTVQDPNNYINYLTGQFVITFPTAPQDGYAINSQVVPVQTSRPQSVLFYNGEFTVRPVPDQPYRINMEVYVQPTQLLANNEVPHLSEWWQYIAFQTSKKIFEDRMDFESVNAILPAIKEQENLILRRTIVQQTSQRVATIYTEGSGVTGSFGSNSNGFGGSF